MHNWHLGKIDWLLKNLFGSFIDLWSRKDHMMAQGEVRIGACMEFSEGKTFTTLAPN